MNTNAIPGNLIAAEQLLCAYLVTAVAADFGRGFRVEKLADGTVYHVNLDGRRSTCECVGFLRWGHCKHVSGLAALLAAGRL